MHLKTKGKIILSGCLVVNDKREILLLYRKDHKHYETPGGKVRLNECIDPDSPEIADFARCAERELYEELGDEIKILELKYFCNVEFKVPDGRTAIAYKFLTKIISGKPRLAEADLFSGFSWIPIESIEDYPVSPDLKLLTSKLKEAKF